MADTKITALTAISTVDPAVDVFPIVDVSDTTMAASGTTKKITSNQLLGAGGTATLASATITGDLTVDTSTLKVDSTNNRVGIGTASPSETLDLTNTSDTGDRAVNIRNSSVRFVVGVEGASGNRFIGSATGNAYAGTTSASGIEFATNNNVRALLDSSGNLGLGVTPSAWGSNSKALQVGGGTASVSSTGAGSTASRFAHGAYFDNTNWLYQYTGVGPALYQVTGANAGSTHAWYIAPGGTAGNAITFTQAMTLTSGGDLQLGVGNLVPISGKGIDFSATANSSGTMTSELLNDYEEGTFTASVAQGVTGITYTSQAGKYTKVGRLVMFYVQVSTSAGTKNSDAFQISGLPFAPTTIGSGVIAFSNSGFQASATDAAPRIYINTSSNCEFYKGQGNPFTGNDLVSGSFDLRFTGSYFV